jgi:anti-anti-sigma regulatory factor
MTISVGGELDLTTTSKLVELAGAILAGDKPGLVLDFAGVLFIDSTCLAGLIKLRTLADTIDSTWRSTTSNATSA